MSRKLFAALIPLLACVFVSLVAGRVAAQDTEFTRQSDVIYGRKFGSALTMDVFAPKSGANGAGIIIVVSGGFFSSHDNINQGYVKPFLRHGYTVFTVVHGSQ